MDEDTGDPAGRESGELGRVRAVVDTARMRVDTAWRAFITHTQHCATCRAGVDCDQVGELKQAYLAAKANAA
ncbi:hypothetical protein [Streptomyces niveus]|uniref:hypothetical protein n=1 Tax=Streptomyces niveus TaxID=193462 RepID=UPI00386E73CE|nr:hypothetical protein OG211_12565 [Streptomyces niveus]